MQTAVPEFDLFGWAVEEVGPDLCHFLTCLLQREVNGVAAHHHASAGSRARSNFQHVGVAVEYSYLVWGYAQHIGRNLGKDRFATLAVGRGFGIHLHMTVALNLDARVAVAQGPVSA